MTRVLLVLVLLLFTAPAFAEDPLSFSSIKKKKWFRRLKPDETAWLKRFLGQGGIKTEPPMKLHVFSVEKTLELFQTDLLQKKKITLPAIPLASNVHGKIAGHRGTIDLLEIKGGAWKIRANKKVGWTKRGSIRAPTIIVLTKEGHYERDLFIDPRAGGPNTPVSLRTLKNKAAIVVHFRGGSRDVFFAFLYDPTQNRIVDVQPWKSLPDPRNTLRPLSRTVSKDALQEVKRTLGIGRSGFIVHKDSRLEQKDVFVRPFSSRQETLVTKTHLLVSSSL